jgi:alpha-methylacyl-CoA racemase
MPWSAARKRIAGIFRMRTRDEWTEMFAGSGACITPVLTAEKARRHPHLLARSTHVEVKGVRAARPRAALQPHAVAHAGGRTLSDVELALSDWLPADRIAAARDIGLIS